MNSMLKRDLGTGDLCDNIGLVGVSAKWSYVTASPSHHGQAIPILSPLLFMHVGHPYIPLFKIQRIFDLLVAIWIAFISCFCVFTDSFENLIYHQRGCGLLVSLCNCNIFTHFYVISAVCHTNWKYNTVAVTL